NPAKSSVQNRRRNDRILFSSRPMITVRHGGGTGLKAPSFAYAKPRTLAEALDLLATHGEGARILAGGQSLIPSLNMRLSAPELLVDITGLKEFSKIE